MSQISEASEEEVLARQRARQERERERRIHEGAAAAAAGEAADEADMVDVVVDAGGFSRGPYGGIDGATMMAFASDQDAESANEELTLESESESAWEADYNDDDGDDEPHF